MSRLFDIAENYRELFDTFDDCDDLTDDQIEAYFDTLEGIEGEFAEKVENIACFIKELTVEADGIKKIDRTRAKSACAATPRA